MKTNQHPVNRTAQFALFAAAELITLFGLLCVAAALFTSLRVFLVGLLSNLWLPGQVPAYEDSQFVAWLIGLMGAVTTAWGAMMFVVIRGGAASATQLAVNALAVSSIVWFTLDSSVSAFTGAYLNILGNVAALCLLLIPLRWLRSTSAPTPQPRDGALVVD